MNAAARLATSLAITVGGIVAACHNDVPRPAIPSPITPEVSRESPKPQPIDTKRKVKPKRVSEAPDASTPAADARAPSETPAPTDAGVTDALNMPEVPDAPVIVVRDAGQPLR